MEHFTGYYQKQKGKTQMWWLLEETHTEGYYQTTWGKIGRERMGGKTINKEQAEKLVQIKLNSGYKLVRKEDEEEINFMAELQNL